MGAVLGFHSMDLSELCAQVETKSSQHTCLAGDGATHVEENEKALEQKVDAVSKFLGSRILWTSYTYDISQPSPVNARLQYWQGVNELGVSGGRKGAPLKKLLLLRTMAPYAGDNLIRAKSTSFSTCCAATSC